MKLIIANWKMYLGLRESVALAKRILRTTSYSLRTQVVLCPSFVALEEVEKVIKYTHIKLGAQDVEPERRGAYTGEVGLDDLRSLRVEYVLVGHSERRRIFHETDAMVNKKLRAVLASGMRPILCVGESWSVRRQGMVKVRRYVGTQVRRGLRGVQRKDLKRVVIAYEPVWAIGTGKPNTPEDTSAMHAFIRETLSKLSFVQSSRTKLSFRVLYGGSVNSKNARAFLQATEVDGLLIGGASTQAKEFIQILQTA